jgi:flagellar assembly factor FliW
MKASLHEVETEFNLVSSDPEFEAALGPSAVTMERLRWNEDQVIRFPAGIPGFESARQFIILSVPQYEPFHWLECVDGLPVRFAIINPMNFRPDYQPRLRRSDLSALNIIDPKDLLMYVIVTLRQPLSLSTANLMGPLFINLKERVGRQILIEDEAYSLREPILL